MLSNFLPFISKALGKILTASQQLLHSMCIQPEALNMKHFLRFCRFNKNKAATVKLKSGMSAIHNHQNTCDQELKTKSQLYFPIWQVTFPLCVFSIFAVSCWTAIKLENGSLIMQVDFQKNSSAIKVNINKHNSSLSNSD